MDLLGFAKGLSSFAPAGGEYNSCQHHFSKNVNRNGVLARLMKNY